MGYLPFYRGKEREEIRKRSHSRSGFSRFSLTVLLGACGTRRARTRSFEGTLRFPQRGKLARLEAPLPFSLRSRNHARSASSHGLLHDLVLALYPGSLEGRSICS
jgi:hypothetical protein